MSERHDTDVARVRQENSGIQDEILARLDVWTQALVSISESLKTIAAAQAPPAPEDAESMAIACLLTVGPNVARIAREVGVSRTQLYTMPRFRRYLDQTRGTAEASRRRLPRGVRTEGGVEAWDRV